jgi:K+-sensing histidine kinase KdpD
MGVQNGHTVLGLRLGESVSCTRSCDMPAGCGTGPACNTCGAAIAMVTSLSSNKPVSKKCAIEIVKNGKKSDLFLRVTSKPVTVDGTRFLLLFLEDISAQKKWEAMERVFFHDINNLLAGVVSASHLLEMETSGDQHYIAQNLFLSSKKMSNEVAIQKSLLSSNERIYKPVWSWINVSWILKELYELFKNHPAAKNKQIICSTRDLDLSIKTDEALLLKVLGNMILNALEASKENETIKIDCTKKDDKISFTVWNQAKIPDDFARRIFQRNVSSKSGKGRGLGTYSMKLFGEDILGGKVDFTTDNSGTLFSFSINST